MIIAMNIGFEKTSYLRCFKVRLGEWQMLSKGEDRIYLYQDINSNEVSLEKMLVSK